MSDDITFYGFPKIPRLSRGCIITEKIDGTNAQVYVGEDGTVRAGSRNRWITPDDDNCGFAAWVALHAEELRQLGPGRHFGEWWGLGIQRRYGMTEKRFSLFNVQRWKNNPPPACCHLVPTLHHGEFNDACVGEAMETLRDIGSVAAPGFMDPEGIVIYHTVSGQLFKKTLKDDAQPKGALTSSAVSHV